MPDTQNASPSLGCPAVEFIGVHKWYGEFHVLRDVSLRVRAGEPKLWSISTEARTTWPYLSPGPLLNPTK
jgi:hypothetical protein